MAENVRVVVRCRPMNKREQDLKCRNIVEIDNCSLFVSNPSDLSAPPKEFTFDNVYGTESQTETIYNDICFTLVDNVLEGYNGTIFAYGQTGCGKSYTMQGHEMQDNFVNTNNGDRGIISRSFDHIFEAISVATDVRYLAIVSFLEIYNENIRDLLSAGECINHVLKETPGLGVTVPTLSTHTVLNAKECYRLLSIGNKNRMMGMTMMNANSSRSHSMFMIKLEQIVNDAEKGVSIDGSIRCGKLNLVDLAGSERQNKTGATGERLKEATKINLSLSALGNVISALVDGKTKHIPYRDSKLTRLLQDSLGGNTKTLMISCISPADNNYDETLSTLRYASRAKNIANKPKINEDPKDAKLREYQEEIQKLKNLLSESVQLRVAESAKLSNVVSKHETDERQIFKEKEESPIILRTEPDSQSEPYKELEGNEATNLQLEAQKRIDFIKQALIGGERAHDSQLQERRQKKKIDAQRRLSALAQALSRVDQLEDRDILQGHYTDIQHELNAKNECLKKYRQKVKVLEREVNDLHAEFQLDRADYLESIRRLERNLKFYQQLIDNALPILRKDGKYWYPDDILAKSVWNDDLKVWKLPQNSMSSFKLPPATTPSSTERLLKSEDVLFEDDKERKILRVKEKKKENVDFITGTCNIEEYKSPDKKIDSFKEDILSNYFRSDRQKSKIFKVLSGSYIK